MKDIETILSSSSLSNASEKIFGEGRTNTKYHNKILKILKDNGYTESVFKKNKSKYKEILKICPICKTSFITLNNKREKNVCSIKCSNIFRGNLSTVTKNKISKSLSGRIVGGIKKGQKKIELPEKPCEFCKILFKPKKNKTRFCSSGCSCRSRRKPERGYKEYRSDSSFKFGLSNYPNEFNFALIEEFGWYSPTNSKSPNLIGVTRDHIYSVMDGFENSIDPLILSHPANCRLMVHGKNASKSNRSDITIYELLEKIKDWDLKYKI